MGVPTDDPITGGPPPPSSSSKDEKKAIGVPNDYTVPQQRHGREELGDVRFRRQPQSYTYDVPPNYFDGDEFIPANWPSTNIWQVQQALAKVGLLTGSFTRNTWDEASRNAYKELLGIANATGQTADRALSELLSTSGGEAGGRWTVDEFGNVVQSGGGEAPPPLVTRTTDPTALRSTFRKAVIDMLGEGWSMEKINQMVAAYNQMEVGKQTEAYNMEIAGEAGTITDMQTPEAFIESQVLKKDPVGVQTEDALGFTQQFMDTVSAPAWGVG